MNQYIDEKNQAMLWNAFQRIPETRHYTVEKQHELFQSVISQHYYSIQVPNFTKEGLQQLNKSTVQQFVSLLRDHHQQQQQQSQPQPQSVQNNYEPQFQYSFTNSEQPSFYETSEERTKRIFDEKQKQYSLMNEKPKMPKPSELFQEPDQDNDGVLQNVDKLIEEYQQQRQQEVPSYNPNPQNPTIVSNNPVDIEWREKYELLEARVKALEESFANIGDIMNST